MNAANAERPALAKPTPEEAEAMRGTVGTHKAIAIAAACGLTIDFRELGSARAHGDLEAHKSASGCWRYPVEALHAWIQSRIEERDEAEARARDSFTDDDAADLGWR